MVWYVKLDWHSECYNSNWVKHFKTYEEAYKRQREVLIDEYKSHYGKKPSKKLTNEQIDDKIDEYIKKRNDKDDHFRVVDYYFSCELSEVKV